MERGKESNKTLTESLLILDLFPLGLITALEKQKSTPELITNLNGRRAIPRLSKFLRDSVRARC